MCVCVYRCVYVCMCEHEFTFTRRRVETLAERTRTQSQTSVAGVELSAGCCSWALQSPESLLTPGPTEPEQRQKGGGQEERKEGHRCREEGNCDGSDEERDRKR